MNIDMLFTRTCPITTKMKHFCDILVVTTCSESSKVQLLIGFTPNHRSPGTYILILRNIAFTRIGGKVKTLPIYDILKVLFELIFVQ